jgi:hypothetical protein
MNRCKRRKTQEVGKNCIMKTMIMLYSLLNIVTSIHWRYSPNQASASTLNIVRKIKLKRKNGGENGRACRTYGRDQTQTKFWLESIKRRDTRKTQAKMRR